jgi:hypothetical protein
MRIHHNPVQLDFGVWPVVVVVVAVALLLL